MNTRQGKERGFSLVEMMVSLTVMLIITVAVFSIIVAEQSTHLTEGRKLDMNQGGRVIEQMFTESFRSAGSVLTLAPTPNMLGIPDIPFNGIYPLNNNDYPDGVILASGDPLALTRLSTDFTPGETVINLMKVDRPSDPEGLIADEVAWNENDYGLIMRNNGYYVFKVTATPALHDLSLAVRTTAAYYSGLLNTAHYVDSSTSGVGVYPAGSPVVRLEYFNIFLVRTEDDGSRTLTLTTDCEDLDDILANTTPITGTRGAPILPNIQDIQIEYLAKIPSDAVGIYVTPHIWAGYSPIDDDLSHPDPCGTNPSVTCTNFYTQFFTKNINTARISVLLSTEEEKNKNAKSGITYDKPVMGDVPAETLPVGRFHYTYMQYEVLIRNYCI